jgi:hypothetical protein
MWRGTTVRKPRCRVAGRKAIGVAGAIDQGGIDNDTVTSSAGEFSFFVIA